MSDERRDDWRQGVDENLASLNAGQRVWEREMAIVRKVLAEYDHLLRGDPEKDTDGTIARLHNQENKINLIEGVLLKDKAGTKKDVVSRLEALESGERTSDNRWKFATAVVVALLSSGLLATNWGRIESFLNKKPTDPLGRLIQNAKHPKARRRHVVIREEPEPAEDPAPD